MAVIFFDTHPVQYLKLGVGWTRHSHVNSLQVTDEKKKPIRFPSCFKHNLERIRQRVAKYGIYDFKSVTRMSIGFAYTASCRKRNRGQTLSIDQTTCRINSFFLTIELRSEIYFLKQPGLGRVIQSHSYTFKQKQNNS